MAGDTFDSERISGKRSSSKRSAGSKGSKGSKGSNSNSRKPAIPHLQKQRSNVLDVFYRDCSGATDDDDFEPADTDWPAMQSGMFLDAEAMKVRLRASMVRPEYDVCNFYKPTGFCQLVARSSIFENTTLAVIGINALWISIDTDLNNAEVLINAHPVFQIMEHAFCFYFAFEWTIRFGAFKRKRNGLRDTWFVFDSFMVFMMVAETWVMSIILFASGAGSGSALGNAAILRLLRLLRLSRMARMAKLLRSLPELLILVKGMLSAMRSVGITILLLFIIIYLFAIAFRQLTDGMQVGRLYFPNMPTAMHTLLRDGTLLDNVGPIVQALEEESVVYVAVFYIFVLLAALTVMNMLIGVLCEVVSAVAATEKETITVATVKDGFADIIDRGGLDTDGDRKISRKEFVAILDCPECIKLLKRVNVDVYDLVNLADFIFASDDTGEGGTTSYETDYDWPKEEKELELAEFLEIVLSLRGGNGTTVKDVVELRKYMKNRFDQVERALHQASAATVKGLQRQGTMSPPTGASRQLSRVSSRVSGSKSSIYSAPLAPEPPRYWSEGRPTESPRYMSEGRPAMWVQLGKLERVLEGAHAKVSRFLASCDGEGDEPNSPGLPQRRFMRQNSQYSQSSQSSGGIKNVIIQNLDFESLIERFPHVGPKAKGGNSELPESVVLEAALKNISCEMTSGLAELQSFRELLLSM